MGNRTPLALDSRFDGNVWFKVNGTGRKSQDKHGSG
jgi:hypothetical protein